MSLASRQAKKATNNIIEQRMKEGFIPTIDYVTAKMGEFYNAYTVGSPFFKCRHQPYRKLFSIENYNLNLAEIYADLTNLYEELVDQFTTVLTDFDYFETERRKLLHRIKELQGGLTDLLLVADDTEGYMYSVHDDFIDVSKVDLDHSTCEINTEAGAVTLKESRSGITKINMSHYFDTINYPIMAEKEYTNNIISNTLFPQSKFGNVFSDATSSWIQNIVCKTPGELKVAFVVDLTPDNEAGTVLTRIEVHAQTPNPMYVEPLFSVDNINFLSLPIGYGEKNKLCRDDKIVMWNFQALNARYIKFLITKPIEDEQISSGESPAYRYTIGFKHIEFFKMGYNNSSVLYSQPFSVTDPAGESLTIDKAALVVEQDVQQGTWIDYYLSLGSDSTDDPTQFNWASVSPVNDPSPSEQQVVDFKHVAFFNNVPDIQWDEASFGTPLETYYGISFYKAYQFPYEPVKNSITMYRGKNDWQVTPSYDIRRKAVYDEAHSFGSLDTITLNFPDFTPVDGDGLIRGSVKLKSDPGQNPGYFMNTPGDFEVNYSTRVITRSTGGVISNDPAAPANTVYVDYQYDDEIVEPTTYTTHVYILNPNGIEINHIPFSQAEMDAGQFTKITTSDGEVDVSASVKFYLSPGWHRITTTAQPYSSSDRFFSVNSSKYLSSLVYTQYAFAEKLQEVSWFDLKYSTLKSDHSRYAVVDYDGDGRKEIIVNYKPQVNPWSSADDDLLCANNAETYVLTYKFITNETNTIYFKAILNRDDTVLPTATPTLHSYTIKLGY